MTRKKTYQTKDKKFFHKPIVIIIPFVLSILAASLFVSVPSSSASRITDALKKIVDIIPTIPQTIGRPSNTPGGATDTPGGGTTNTPGGTTDTPGGGTTNTPGGGTTDTPTDICSSVKNLPAELKKSAGCPDDNGTSSSGQDDPLAKTIENILYRIILFSGIIAVIFIIIGGIQYITSTGDANKIKKAKDTILYACIGLIICALAFAIVNFTLSLIYNS